METLFKPGDVVVCTDDGCGLYLSSEESYTVSKIDDDGMIELDGMYRTHLPDTKMKFGPTRFKLAKRQQTEEPKIDIGSTVRFKGGKTGLTFVVTSKKYIVSGLYFGLDGGAAVWKEDNFELIGTPPLPPNAYPQNSWTYEGVHYTQPPESVLLAKQEQGAEHQRMQERVQRGIERRTKWAMDF